MGKEIYTRSGDNGTTSLVDGTRVSKTHPRVEAYGTIDEANSWIGAARSFTSDSVLERCLEFVQHRMYNCSSHLATPPNAQLSPTTIAQTDVDWLESCIDYFQNRAGEISGFIVPGGCQDASLLHLARTVCRRAERLLIALSHNEDIDQLIIKFINRCSDFLFAAARYANHQCADGDVHWDKSINPPSLPEIT